MGFGANLLKVGIVVPKEWRPFCWMNENYDINEPCNISPEDAKYIWCCEECPFRWRIKK